MFFRSRKKQTKKLTEEQLEKAQKRSEQNQTSQLMKMGADFDKSKVGAFIARSIAVFDRPSSLHVVTGVAQAFGVAPECKTRRYRAIDQRNPLCNAAGQHVRALGVQPRKRKRQFRVLQGFVRRQWHAACNQ